MARGRKAGGQGGKIGPQNQTVPGRRRGAYGLLAAWMLLLAVVGIAVVYVYWPAIERQILGPATEQNDEARMGVDVGPAQPVPSLPAGAQDEAAPTAVEQTPQLDLSGPQSAPLPDIALEAERADRVRSTDEAVAEPDRIQQGTPQETSGEADPGVPPQDTQAAAAVSSPSPSDTQTAAVPRAPEAMPEAPVPPAMPAWQRFARPFTSPADRPLIAIVITGLGLNGPRTLQAIEQLPPEISLSFSPYAKQTEEFMRTARAFGHEVLVDLPMEPATRDDPGTMALLTGLAPDANLDRLGLVLGRGRNYVGVVGSLGSRFVGDPSALEPVLQELGRRGLLYVDNRPVDRPHAALKAVTLGLPVAINDRSLDARMAATPAVDASLAQVERIARERGTAVALGQPNPTTLAFLAEWVKTLPGKGLALAPVTAVANTQPVR
ncbi:divergent polysaccharide deacetylase family protein [Algihabitans albus]|uniref:divergent polysaccharide deacetylase family protein n=1 Tax=Algihabitans albus TaxID=2164067 RepID=UPI0035CFCC1F